MSKLIAQILLGALVVLAVGLAAVTLLSLAIGFLVPIATAGAVAPGFVQSVGIVALGLIASGLLKSSVTVK